MTTPQLFTTSRHPPVARPLIRHAAVTAGFLLLVAVWSSGILALTVPQDDDNELQALVTIDRRLHPSRPRDRARIILVPFLST